MSVLWKILVSILQLTVVQLVDFLMHSTNVKLVRYTYIHSEVARDIPAAGKLVLGRG